ncbi:MAG TPA: SxtJ family membrane protein [Isosphaeraceae bacterium]|jgi:hypothetical protein|nr:SxtJ family membrane protein [Isosphaeraceae bacterium]
MSLVPINWKPDRKLLAEFSEFWLFFVGMVFAPMAYFRGYPRLAMALWIVAVAVRLVGWLRPMWVKPFFLGLTLATWPMGWVFSHLALVGVYYIIFTPVALLFRLLGRDPLKRTFDREASSYWEPYNPSRGLDRYLRQF